jgi:tellurite resistance protein TehA-like permease
MVFPLGMYSVCGMLTGGAFGAAWIDHIGQWWFVVALAAWVVVAAGEAHLARRRLKLASPQTRA